MAAADKHELEELIRTSGPYKADFIIRCSQEIIDRYGGSIEWMRTAPTREAREALLGLYGVGPKTADCVLLFSLGHSVVPVDTHICRVSERTGLSMATGRHAKPPNGRSRKTWSSAAGYREWRTC